MEILVDTSVWVDFLAAREPVFKKYLQENNVWVHPFVIGEIATGSIKNRVEILNLMQSLPTLEILEHDEVMYFLEQHQFYAKGIGWVDLHLLAASMLFSKPIWTKDKRLRKLAQDLGTAV